MRSLALLFLLTALASPARAPAQSVFLDVNGDGRCDATDVLLPSITSVDIWFVTDRDAAGTVVTCGPETGHPMSFFSYQVVLHAWGDGSVTYGAWIPELAVPFRLDLGTKFSGSDCYIAYGGMETCDPGRYKVGTLRVTVTGHPRLSFLTRTAALRGASTSFGSECPGVDWDDTIKLGSDFTDAAGTAALIRPADPGSAWTIIQQLYR